MQRKGIECDLASAAALIEFTSNTGNTVLRPNDLLLCRGTLDE
jgi:hypothetical protein